MANELALTFQDQQTLSAKLATSSLVPQVYRNRPENLLYALQYAEALGVHPMTAITSIHVIEGKPTASADLIAGLIRRAGHKLRVRATDTEATAEIIRADDPSYTFTVTWTMERAKTAGLTGKGPWKSYPAAMLKARAITEVARLACSECLFGVIYTPEELGAQVDGDGDPVDVTPQPTVSVVEVKPARDWAAEAAACESVPALRVLYAEAKKAGVGADVLDRLKARSAELTAPPPAPPPAEDAPFFPDEPPVGA